MKNSKLSQFKTSELEALNAKELEMVVGGADETGVKAVRTSTSNGGDSNLKYCNDEGECTEDICQDSDSAATGE